MGLIFPGVDINKINEGLLKRNKRTPKPPRLQVLPLLPNGTLIFEFDQDMIAPKIINQTLYKSIFKIKLLRDTIDE